MGSNLPIILIEVVLIFGGVLAFGWWQLRSIKHDQEQAARQRAQQPMPVPAAPPSSDPP